MMYETATAFRAALEERLKSYAKQHKVPLVRLRKIVAFDRLLARLVAGSPDRWVLKGAMVLSYRYGDRTRTTMDLDLVRQDDEETAQTDLMSALRTDLHDFFVFSAERVGPSGDPGVRSTRYRAVAELAGRPFETIRIDVAFDDPLVAEPETVQTSTLLEFAGIDPVSVSALTVEQHIAEKIHAYTRTYGQGRVSSRVKDLTDLLLIASLSRPSAGRLRKAVRRVFEARAGQAIPDQLPAPPESWNVPFRRLAEDLGMETDLGVGYKRVAEFLNPVLDSTAEGTWNPERWVWESRPETGG